MIFRNSMYIRSKIIFLYLLKFGGIFLLAKFFNRNKLRILCYHGISLEDEHKFIPSNFIKFTTLQKKVQWLRKSNYTIISLEQAIRALKNKQNLRNCVVITFDDGFESILEEAFPWFIKENIPVTLYLTSYYAQNRGPIFRLAVQYLCWKSTPQKIQLGKYTLETKSDDSIWKFINNCEKQLTHKQRNDLLNAIQDKLNIKLSLQILKSLSIISAEKIKELDQNHIDIQLHTHRHLFPADDEIATKELQDNIEFLKRHTNSSLKHFCYPSGIWSPKNFQTLEKFHIASATTCEPGLVKKDDHLLALPRIIESQKMSLIQFQAEILGIGDALRNLIKRLKT